MSDGFFSPQTGGASARAPLAASLHAFETQRLDSLRVYDRFAPPNDPTMLSIAQQAKEACGAPVGIVSMMAGDEERFVAHLGIDLDRIDREDSFCAYAVLESDVLVVEDTQTDPRFRDNPYVVGEPHVRFYAGAPIFDEQGLPLGVVCVVGYSAREATSRCRHGLRRLAEVTSATLQARRLFAQTLAACSDSIEAAACRARFEVLLLTLVDPRASLS